MDGRLPPTGERLRFDRFVLDRAHDGRCRARVELTWRGTERFIGEAEGMASATGELRCAAQATLTALEQVLPGGEPFELLGVKAVKAFDETVVIVSLALPSDPRGQRMVGSCLAGDEIARGAALAVLNATNRVMGNRLHMR
ncbi:MAG: hypothetical protein NW201_06230 [Gemmatimonadales bacterium]|nr:hypothetical protein [Gemmatimonadales bacterium]